MFCLLLAAAGFLIYSGSLGGPFVYDDKVYITHNPWIRSLGNFIVPLGLRYVGDLSFALNYSLSGLEPFSYHAVNTAIHVLNAIFLFLFLNRLSKTPFFKTRPEDAAAPVLFSLSAAFLFLTHPVQVQAVAYVSQRYTSLAALFYLVSLYAFLEARLSGDDSSGLHRRSFYIAAVVSSVLGMKTKEICFTLPFMVALIDYTVFPGRPWKERALWLAPLFATALLIPLGLLLPEFGIAESGNKVEAAMRMRKYAEAVDISRYDYLLTQTTVVVTYLRLLFFPFGNATIDHPMQSTFLEPRVLASSFAILAVLAAALLLYWRALKKRNVYGMLAATGVAWIFVTLSIESSIIPIKDVFNERRLYLPSMGASIAFISAVFAFSEYLRKKPGLGMSGYVPVIAAFLVAVPFSYATYAKSLLWSDSLMLYEDEVKRNPHTTGPRVYLGIEYFDRGMPEEALSQFIAARDMNPDSVFIHKTMSRFYYNTGKLDKSIDELKTVLRLRPDELEAHNNLGMMYLKQGRLAEAEASLKEVLRLRPGQSDATGALKRIQELKATGMTNK